jgi:methylamine dehydrogenase heavy chain
VIDLDSGRRVARLPGHNTASLTFSKSGQRLQALDGVTGALRVWDWPTAAS